MDNISNAERATGDTEVNDQEPGNQQSPFTYSGQCEQSYQQVQTSFSHDFH
jgi:hypothetical protein